MLSVPILKISNLNLEEVLKPKLLGRVFHVTSHLVAKRILDGENLRTNETGELSSGFSTNVMNGFFRLKGCISLFDFRNPTEEGLQKALEAGVFNPDGHAKNSPAFLFLNPVCFDKLIPNNLWGEEKAYNTTIVPYVECGYSGDIASEFITEVLFVEVLNTQSILEDMVRASYL